MELTEKLSMKRMIEFVNNKFTGDEYVKASEIIEMLEVGIVEDEVVKECDHDWSLSGKGKYYFCKKCGDTACYIKDEAVRKAVQCPFAQALMCYKHECACCKTSAEWFANKSKVDPDPILEVYDVVNSRNDMESLMAYAEDMWIALKKYAQARGRK